jgi:hypothetical protein
MPKALKDVRSNQLLGALEAKSRKRIESHLEPIKLKLGAVVCEAGGDLTDILDQLDRDYCIAALLSRWSVSGADVRGAGGR